MKTSIRWLLVQIRRLSAWQKCSEQQLEFGTGAFSSHSLQQFSQEESKPGALQKHGGKVTISVRTITKLRFADVIDTLAEEKEGTRNRT